MKKQFIGLDVLRGFALFMTLWMHTSFYFFDGLYDLDLNNPPLIVTVIGFLLMFAGLFAMISAFVHTHQSLLKQVKHQPKNIWQGQWVSALFIFIIGYAYFLFTGPGLVNMTEASMDNSLLVGFIRDGIWTAMSLDRWLYVDSLIMLASNIFLLSIVFYVTSKMKLDKRSMLYIILALGFFILSLVRIPLYEIYLQAVENNQWGITLLLNWIVNKNNPVFPFFSFGLLGSWLALRVHQKSRHTSLLVLIVGGGLFVLGLVLYMVLPDTMLQRSIDLKWFAIMMFQMGLFVWLVYGFVFIKGKSVIQRFFQRLGTISLSVFFVESVVAALVYRIFIFIFGPMYFDLIHALIYGFIMATFWGLFVMVWEKTGYKGSLEHLYVRIKSRYIETSKKERVKLL